MIRALYLIELTVADWPAAVAWYRDVFGLPLLHRDETNRFALLRAGAGRLALKEGPPRPGSVLLAFEVDDLPAELARLASHGVTIEAPIKASAEGYRRAILRDPAGYRLALFDWGEAE